MHTRRFGSTAVALSTLALLLASACGSSAEEPQGATTAGAERPAPPEPVELLPADAFLVMRADLQKLRASPYWPTVEGWIGQMQRAAASSGESSGAVSSLAAVLDRTDEILVALAPPSTPGGEPATLVVARGAYEPGELGEYLAEQARRRGFTEPPRVEARDGRDVIVAGEAAGVDVDGEMWLAATDGRIDEMLRRLEQRAGASPLAADRFRSMAERVQFESATLALVAEATPEVKDRLRARVPGTAQPMVDSLVSFGAQAELSAGIDLQVIAVTSDPAVAQGLAAYAQRMLDRADGNMFARMLGAQGLIDATTISVDGPEATMVLDANDEVTRTALDRLGGFIGLVLQAAVSGQGEMPTVPGMEGGSP